MEEPFPSIDFEPRHLSVVSNWHGHMSFAYDLMSELKPNLMVELGTHFGDSYFAFCQARRELNLETTCYAVDTWKGDEQAGEYGEHIYQKVCQINEDCYPGFSHLVRSTFTEALPLFDDESIDLLHIDGFHSYEAVEKDFSEWLPKVCPGGIILLHDADERQPGFGVWKLWEEIKDEYPHFLFKHNHGLGVLQKAQSNGEPFRIGRLELDEESAAGKDYLLLQERFLWKRKAHAKQNEAEQLLARLMAMEEELKQKKATLARMERSLWWRLTKFLRKSRK
jgi:hypothetical protein